MTVDDCAADQLCLDGMCVDRDTDAGPRPDGGDAGRDATVDGPDIDAGPDDRILPPGACLLDAVPDAFEDPARELHWEAVDGMAFAGMSHVVSTPVVIDMLPEPPDADAVPEIVFTSYSSMFNTGGVIRVLDGRAPHTLRLTLAGDGSDPVESTAGVTARLQDDTHLAAGDIDGDGFVEIVSSLLGGGAIAWRRDGTEMWRVTPADLPSGETESNGAWSLHDLEGDGTVEAIIGRSVLEGATGAVRFIGSGTRGMNGQGPLSCVGDIVPDSPGQEIIAGGTVYSPTGDVVWSVDGDGFCAVADVLNEADEPGADGLPEVIRVVGGNLRIHTGATGAMRANFALPGCGGGFGNGGAPTIADFDGDGVMEIGVAGARCYAVVDFACTADTPGCVGRNLLWTRATEDTSSNVTSSTVFDFNGDGRAEVVYNDEQYFMVLEGLTGAIVFREPNPSRTRTEQPIVADVDADGNAEIIFGGNAEHPIAGAGTPAAEIIPGLEVWSSSDDSWVGARPIWNQHTYHIDHVDDRGAIRSPEMPSWMTHNTYRLNRANGDSLAGPDLAGDAVPSACAADTITLCLTIRNRGETPVAPGLVVAFHQGSADGPEVARGMTTRSLARGEETMVCGDWSPAPTEATPIVAVIDPDGTERECFEDNNEVSFEAVCAGPG